MPKTFLKKSTGWTEIKSIFVKKSTGWAEVKNVFLKKTSGWVKVFTKLSLPDTTTAPSIRTTNTSGTGTIYDGPVATSPQYLNADLFGKDGTYTNYTSIFGRKFTRASTSSAITRTTIVNDDRFTSAGGVTTAMRTACDEQYLFYELTVQNGSSANEIYPISSAIKMIKSYPALIDCGWNETEAVGTQLNFDYSLENYYYNSIEPSSSYIRWWRSNNTDPGGTLIKQETITDTTTGTPSSSSRAGTSSYTPTSSDIGYYIVAEIIAVSSYTRHNGYTDNFSLASFPTDGVIGSALTFSNVAVKDYYGNNGLDNRDRWPTGTLNQYTGQLSGYDSNTTIRIRYRIYNYDTGLYWKPSTGTQTTASAAWDSWNSDGSGNGYISNVSVSGGVATFYDYFDLDASTFNGGGSGPTWWLEIELSAVRGGPRVYYNNSNLIPETYYISKRIDPTVSVSPSTVGLNTNVTISGTFAGFPATPSTNAYPRQYKVDYGDGTDSGWLPVGGYAYGTLNPSYSLTKSYSTGGTYTVRTRTIPFGTDATTTITVASVKTAPTVTNVTQSSLGGQMTVTVSGGSGPAYQMYWKGGADAPGVSVTPDGASNTTTIIDSTGPSSTGTYYVFARSSATTTSTDTTAPTTIISEWSSGYQFVLSATRYLFFDANGGSGGPSSQTGIDSGSGASITITSSIPSRSGYTFDGWTIASNGSGTVYTGGNSITIYGDTTLYAKWTANNLTAPTNVQVTGSAGNHSVSFSGGSGPYFQVYWTTVSTTSTTSYDQSGFSSPITVTNLVNPIGGTTYYFFVRSVSALSNVGTGPSSTISSWSSPGSWTAPVSPPSLTSFTISPTTPTVGTTITVTANWANNPTSTSTKITRGTANVISSESTVAGPNASNTASYTIQSGDVGLYLAGFSTASNSGGTTGPSKTTSPVEIGPVTQPFTPPSSGTPSWSSASNFQRISGSSILRWYTDYPSISGDGSFSGMQFEIRTTAGGGTLLASGTRSYPGAGTYPYSGGGTVWAFRCGTSDGDISYSASARYARVRTVMLGTNGTTYYGSWTGWI